MAAHDNCISCWSSRMTRRGSLSLLVLIAAAPVLAAPALKPVNKVPSLVGTTWSGNSFENQTMTLEFAADGQVTVTYNGNPVANTSWKQDGEKVHFSLNNNYCEFDGKYVEGRIVGQCYNIAGNRWDVTLTRVTPDK
jgi:hypothetical protein